MARKADAEIHGLLVLDKPAGWTSHDVVARVRRLTTVRRVGHAGTLDPLATGLLVLGIGQGTRVLEYATDADKRYSATLRLGISTDTYDADGAVIRTRSWQQIPEAAVRATLTTFLGEIQQRPPAYSAIKQGGVPLHRLARAGQAVELPPRNVTIYEIEVRRIQLPEVELDVHCAKGTYIRSLAHDLGELLGCGAHLTALRRTASGGIMLAQALTLADWEAALADGSWPARLLPLDAPLAGQPALVLGTAEARRLLDGVAPAHAGAAPGTLARAYSGSGLFLGILRATGVDPGWEVEKVLLGRVSAAPASENS